jgi:hypothetical protein
MSSAVKPALRLKEKYVALWLAKVAVNLAAQAACKPSYPEQLARPTVHD